jgi:hypothetical protein
VVFARETSDGLTSLVKKIEAATTERKGLRSFVVFLTDEEGTEKKLKDLAAKEGLKNTILTVDNPAGPPAYKIARDADVTVVYYVRHSVKANHAFKKGELKEAGVEAAVQDLDKIAPK